MLNTILIFQYLKQHANKAALAFLALALLSSLSCGKRLPPLPPEERVGQRVEASAFQRGGQVLLNWKMPARNAAAGSVQRIVRADIYRLAEPLNASLTLSEEEFASKSVLIGSLPIADEDFGLKTLTYVDSLQFATQPVRLRYSIRLVNESGQRAAFSNFLVIEPVGSIAAAPTQLIATVSQENIMLRWTRPAVNEDGTSPANILGFNIYRSDDGRTAAKLLNSAPLTKEEFSDEFFSFDKEQGYFVRTVSSGTNGQFLESNESNIIKLTPKDTFAPSPPSAITLAASPNVISIFFASNPEKDVAGYRIYRSTDPSKDKAAWELITPKLLTTNTFQDKPVSAGTTYFYYIKAEDTHGNVSDASEIVSETLR